MKGALRNSIWWVIIRPRNWEGEVVRLILILLAGPMLAGCSGASLREARLADIAAQCREYGHVDGSEAHKNCMMAVDIAARNQ